MTSQSLPESALPFQNGQPPLPWITLLGLDGSGKSTILAELKQQLSPLKIIAIHRRPGIVYRTSHHHEKPTGISHYHKPPHSYSKSIFKLLIMVCDWHVGYWRTIKPARYNNLVITDRHSLLDLISDPLRYRYGGPASLVRLAMRLTPMPNFILFLDAPIQVLHARKQELSLEKAGELRAAYIHLIKKLPNSKIINAAQPIEQVAQDIISALVLFMEG